MPIPPGYTKTLKQSVTVGDDYTLERSFPDVPEGQQAAQATWKVVRATDNAVAWQKVITTADVTDVGQIEDPGTNGSAQFRFDVTEAETGALVPGLDYLYTIVVTSTAGKRKTIESGHFVAQEQL
jgi:hypothetical protein